MIQGITVDVKETRGKHSELLTVDSILLNRKLPLFPVVGYFQGGPGFSSTGLGNFQEIGPYDTNMLPRNTTWVRLISYSFISSFCRSSNNS